MSNVLIVRCAICGGVESVSGGEPDTPFKWCDGHPEPTRKKHTSKPKKIPSMTFTGHVLTEEHRLPPIKAMAGDGRLPVEPKTIRCEQCNGVQALTYEYRGGPLGSVTPVMPTGSYPAGENGANIGYPLYPVCQCPKPELAVNHDGKLGKDSSVHINNSKLVVIEEYDEVLYLYPSEALSLLAWLRQEESELLRMAKEQGE